VESLGYAKMCFIPNQGEDSQKRKISTLTELPLPP
jgi:hypothetical protein